MVIDVFESFSGQKHLFHFFEGWGSFLQVFGPFELCLKLNHRFYIQQPNGHIIYFGHYFRQTQIRMFQTKTLHHHQFFYFCGFLARFIILCSSPSNYIFEAISWVKARFLLANLIKKHRSFPISIAAAHKAVFVAASWCFGNDMRYFVHFLSKCQAYKRRITHLI